MALIELSVENLAVIESVRLPLAPGFTAVTGETGAGKSLVVDAVALALGGRAAADQVRAGRPLARVEAIFDGAPEGLPEHVADLVAAGEGLLIVRREVSAEGRSVARINDRAVTIGTLAELGSMLGELHGQHDQQRLLVAERQLALLDRFGELGQRRDATEDAYRAWRAAVAAAAELTTDPQELARRVELLSHQVDEIAAAGLEEGEDARIEAQLRAADHAETVARAAAEALRLLAADGGGTDATRLAVRALDQAARHDERFAPMAERVEGVAAELEELARDVRALSEEVELDPVQRQALEERLTLIHDLQRKYGPSVGEVLAFGERAATELAELADQEGLRERRRQDEGRARAALEAAATELGATRREAAARLVERVNAELPPLGLRGGAFGIEVDPVEIGPAGADTVTFTFAPNPGEPPRPLSRIASGGEASRVALAVKVVLAAADDTGLLVFDEVDAGIGGRNAAALGERLRQLSRFHQVLCVTHLPQVAAFADAHLVVGKLIEGGRTFTQVRALNDEERTAELAAMLGGEAAGDEAHAAAAALLRGAGR